MIEESYVNFETAKLLKEKGFYQDFFSPIIPVWHYNGNKEILSFIDDSAYPCHWEEWYSAPTLSMAMRWLREVHKLAIIIFPQWAQGDMRNPCRWRWEIRGLENINQDMYGNPLYSTYEEATEAAIKYCLENLI